jgi:hypothetical protein
LRRALSRRHRNARWSELHVIGRRHVSIRARTLALRSRCARGDTGCAQEWLTFSTRARQPVAYTPSDWMTADDGCGSAPTSAPDTSSAESKTVVATTADTTPHKHSVQRIRIARPRRD